MTPPLALIRSTLSVPALTLLLVFFGVDPLGVGVKGMEGQEDGAALEVAYLCPPAASRVTSEPMTRWGNCGACGMGLVPLSSVPQVGVLIHPQASPSSTLLPLSLFASSNASRSFTVADTDQPMRLGDAVEVRPQFGFDEAPPLDVLVVPDGYGAWDDALIVDWVRGAAERARFVLVIGSGSLVLARAGFLEGERVPAPAYLIQRGKELAPGLVFDGETSWRRADKFFLARDPEAALDAALTIVSELGGEARAQSAAERFGRPWPVESSRAK